MPLALFKLDGLIPKRAGEKGQGGYDAVGALDSDECLIAVAPRSTKIPILGHHLIIQLVTRLCRNVHSTPIMANPIR